MKEISKTMVFIRLCQYHVEESEKCAWVQKTIGELFVYSHDILSHKFIVSQQDINSGKVNIANGNSSFQKVADSQKQAKSVTQFSLSSSKPANLPYQSPIKVPTNTIESPLQDEMLTPTKHNSNQKRAYGWKIADLLNKQQKYYQYVEYLFDKNFKQIVNATNIIEEYLGAEQNKYTILMSNNQFQSFQSLQSINLPTNFGNMPKDQQTISLQKDKDKQQRLIYEQLYKQQAIKSKKWKKFGEKDEQDLYEQYPKICTQIKLQKLLIKYIKQIQLNHPQAVLKGKKSKKTKPNKNTGFIDWFWDLVHPLDVSRIKQQSEIKSSIQKKIDNKLSKINIANLYCLFQQSNRLDDQDLESRKNKGKEQGKNGKKLINSKQYQKNIQQVIQNTNNSRLSRAHSDVVKCERKASSKEEKR